MAKTKVRLTFAKSVMEASAYRRALVTIFIIVVLSITLGGTSAEFGSAQRAIPTTPDELVTYQKQSGFIKEFAVPFEELGLGGIVADAQGNAWFLHSTNTTSGMVMLDSENSKFTRYPIEGETAAENAVINLATGQLALDKERNAIWFTDARTNSVGKLEVATGKISLFEVPTENAGPMGISLSPDGKTIWFAEITGDKIGSIDAESEKMTEYQTGDGSGPTLLTFDGRGILWVTLSFSNSVLRVDTQSLSSDPSSAMTELRLSGDIFSPFGIAVSDGKVYVSDHGSSRVIVTDEGFADYTSYWTSPSIAFPVSLPSQVVADGQGNVYFPQHGGNRISAIDRTGVMTEYEIPTGPLSTAVFVAASDDGKVWFVEWASNKAAYLDTSVQVPFVLDVKKAAVTLDRTGPQSIAVSLNSSLDPRPASPVAISEVEIGITGMTEIGPQGVTYEARPPRVNLQDASSAESDIHIRALENARPGIYVAMVKASAPENDDLIVSRLYPIELVLDVPEPVSGQGDLIQDEPQSTGTTVQDVLRIAAPAGAAVVIAFAIYRWRKARRKKDSS